MGVNIRLFEDVHLEFIRKNVVGLTKQELTELVNKEFSASFTTKQIVNCCKRHKMPISGLTGHFGDGREVWNKGKKGWSAGGNSVETRFKKGEKPMNYKPIGSEVIDADGYIRIKVCDKGRYDKRWVHKHRILWEQAYGKIEKGHCLVFLDFNKLNVNLNNLQLIKQSQQTRLLRYGLRSTDPEVTKLGIKITEVFERVAERSK